MLEDTRKGFLARVARLESEMLAAKAISSKQVQDLK